MLFNKFIYTRMQNIDCKSLVMYNEAESVSIQLLQKNLDLLSDLNNTIYHKNNKHKWETHKTSITSANLLFVMICFTSPPADQLVISGYKANENFSFFTISFLNMSLGEQHIEA